MPNLQTRVRELRTEKGLTQDDLAKAVGVSRKTIVYLEKNEYIPSLYLAWKIAEIFEAPIEEIFSFTN